MEEKQLILRRHTVLNVVAGVLLLGLFGVGLVLTGQARAQGEPTADPTAEAHQMAEQIIVGGNVMAFSTTAGIGHAFPFEAALRRLAAEGMLSQEDVDSIMTDLSGLTDAVNYTSTTSPDGQTKEITVDVDIRSDDTTLPTAMQQALDNAVANGLLTAEQAAEVMAEVEAAPDPTLHMAPGTLMQFDLAGPMAAEQLLDGPLGLGQRLDEAVTAGTITSDEAQAFRDILTKLLAATE